MTKKDYILIAKALNIHAWNSQGQDREQKMLISITETFCEILKSNNTRFDKVKFVEAVFKK